MTRLAPSLALLLGLLPAAAWGQEAPADPAASSAEAGAEDPVEDGAVTTGEGSDAPPGEVPPSSSRTADEDVTPPPGTFVPEPGLREGLYEPDEPPVEAPALEKKRTARRIYPRKLGKDMSQTLRCDVRVVLDEKGRPTQVLPDGCVDEPLFEHTVRRVRKDRWVKPTPMGAEVPVEVVYVPPVDQMKLPEAPYWRRRMQTVCRAHLQIAADGGVVIERQDGDCGLAVDQVAPTPAQVPRGRTPEVCELTFLGRDGDAVQVERFRCGLRMWKHAMGVLDAIAWTEAPDHPGGPQPWSVLLQFDR